MWNNLIKSYQTNMIYIQFAFFQINMLTNFFLLFYFAICQIFRNKFNFFQ